MKSFTFILSFLFAFPAMAQDTIVTYLNENWKETEKEYATYYRKAFLNNDNNWSIFDYYISGVLQMKGDFKDDSLKIETGTFTYYHENGNLYEQGEYVNGNRVGKWIEYFSSGKLYCHKSYDNEGNKTGYWKTFWDNGKINNEGQYSENKREGIWKFYFYEGQIASEESYENDKATKITFWNEKGKRIKGKHEAFVNHEFKGGLDGILRYLEKNITYPEQAKDSGIEGKVYINFIVDENGKVQSIKVLRSVHRLLDNEAIRVIKKNAKMETWKRS